MILVGLRERCEPRRETGQKTMNEDWPRRSVAPALLEDEVHLWLAKLDSHNDQLDEWYRSLAPDECERASRFHFAKDRNRFVARRAILRQILGEYLGAESAAIQFAYDKYGKPSLRGGVRCARLRFNASHANCLALIGVCLGRDLGVDIEHVRPEFVRETIPEQFFAPSEVQILRALPPNQQVVAFFNCWTRKEAYIKAIGKGLSQPLDHFEVSLRPGEPAAILRIAGDEPEAGKWSLHALTPTTDYIAAVAVRNRSHCVRSWEWAVSAHHNHS